MLNIWFATIITSIAAVSWLRLNDYFAHKGLISGQTSRKIIHIGTGPIFVLCWLLFPDEDLSRFFAAIIPLLITLQFLMVGLGIIKDQAAVDAMTRHGDRREILRGPLIYGIVFVCLTIFYWKYSPIGIVALMMLCGGDGLADIIGKRYGNKKLPWSGSKSWAGSLAMFLGGTIFSILVLLVFEGSGYFHLFNENNLVYILLIGLICTIVESFPVKEFDNLTVPVAAILLGQLLF
jgi:phytol kinase